MIVVIEKDFGVGVVGVGWIYVLEVVVGGNVDDVVIG